MQQKRLTKLHYFTPFPTYSFHYSFLALHHISTKHWLSYQFTFSHWAYFYTEYRPLHYSPDTRKSLLRSFHLLLLSMHWYMNTCLLTYSWLMYKQNLQRYLTLLDKLGRTLQTNLIIFLLVWMTHKGLDLNNATTLELLSFSYFITGRLWISSLVYFKTAKMKKRKISCSYSCNPGSKSGYKICFCLFLSNILYKDTRCFFSLPSLKQEN